MINFLPIASSSKGNAYIVADALHRTPSLLLEAGITLKALRERIGFNVSSLAGVLVSHEHMDHAKAVKDLLKAGTDCYMSQGTADALEVSGYHRTNIVCANVQTKIGAWTVMPFPLEHDAADPQGFLIGHEADRLLFVPDTAFVSNRFEGVTVAAIECNHISDVLIDNVIDGWLPAVVARRIRRSHMSLEQVISMLKANDLSKCRHLYLLHLSDGNSDEKRMVLEVQQATGIPTTAC